MTGKDKDDKGGSKDGLPDTSGKKRMSKEAMKASVKHEARFDKTRQPGKGEIDDQENYRQGRQGPK